QTRLGLCPPWVCLSCCRGMNQKTQVLAQWRSSCTGGPARARAVHVALINQPRRLGVNGLDVMSALGEPSVAARPRTAPPLLESVSAIPHSPTGTTLPATEQTFKRVPERL